jgi:hypothetical protein
VTGVDTTGSWSMVLESPGCDGSAPMVLGMADSGGSVTTSGVDSGLVTGSDSATGAAGVKGVAIFLRHPCSFA